jgi:hypothetical protein
MAWGLVWGSTQVAILGSREGYEPSILGQTGSSWHRWNWPLQFLFLEDNIVRVCVSRYLSTHTKYKQICRHATQFAAQGYWANRGRSTRPGLDRLRQMTEKRESILNTKWRSNHKTEQIGANTAGFNCGYNQVEEKICMHLQNVKGYTSRSTTNDLARNFFMGVTASF